MTIKDDELEHYPASEQIRITGEAGEVLVVDTCNCFILVRGS